VNRVSKFFLSSSSFLFNTFRVVEMTEQYDASSWEEYVQILTTQWKGVKEFEEAGEFLFRLTSGNIRDRRLQVYHAAGVGSRNRRQNKLKPRFRRIRGCATHQG